MVSKKFDREQMQRCLDVLDELAHSGLSAQDFAQAQGRDLQNSKSQSN